MKLNMYLLSKDKGLEKIEIETGDCKDFYNYIGCDIIDITCRQINGIWYDIVLDDCGLLVDNPTIMAFKKENNDEIIPLLAGNLIFTAPANQDTGEYDRELNEDEINNLKNNIFTVIGGNMYGIDLDIYNAVFLDY